ncbi:hypothetical protein OH77DRAFT_1416044 [Trametes cingulata]|nr:hypothetical protein OH77DRAFT_1429524 [Trametes cingulata]KAI0361866.1 hypothetical protein OH77DRAFT_1416044 [Trametes cingulata]
MASEYSGPLQWVAADAVTPPGKPVDTPRKRTSRATPYKQYTGKFNLKSARSSGSTSALPSQFTPSAPNKDGLASSLHTWALETPTRPLPLQDLPVHTNTVEDALLSTPGPTAPQSLHNRPTDSPHEHPGLVYTSSHSPTSIPVSLPHTATFQFSDAAYFPATHLGLQGFATPHTPASPSPATARSSHSQSRKRKQDENEPPTDHPEVPPGARKWKHRKTRDELVQLSRVLNYIYDELDWTVGEFLHALFKSDPTVRRTARHVGAVTSFLQGRANVTPAHILDLWYKHPAGTISWQDTEYKNMFSTYPEHFHEARSVRVALTTFAAQVVSKELVKEAERAVKPESGLHASRRAGKPDSTPSAHRTKIVWADVGAATVSRVSDIITRLQPLLRTLLLAVAERHRPAASRPGGSLSVVHQKRPAEIVVTNVISTLDFSRSNRANLLPITRALFHFAVSAPYDLYLHGSRIGFMPAYTTTYRALEQLAQQEAQTVRAHGRDEQQLGCIWFDNVQNYLLQRDARIGRLNALRIGTAATYVETPDTAVSALDLDDKRRRVAANLRGSLTVSQLVNFVDQRHRETVGVLHWLRVLVHHVPQLEGYKKDVSLRFRTRAARQRLPVKAANVHPLATSGKNETITTELKDGLVDFLEQCGQEPDNYHRRLVLCGGDGLTYEKMLQLKNYLQYHSDPFESLEIVQPVLAPWHTVWTDTSRVIESHWGAYLSPDPSTLGHNAAKIKRRAPPNLRKVDFESGSELVRICFEARVLDCWRTHHKAEDLFAYFAELAARNAIPSFEDLEAQAKTLYRAYCTQHAAERALDPVANLPRDSEHSTTLAWKATVPLGSPWTRVPGASAPPQETQSDASLAIASTTTDSSRQRTEGSADSQEEPFVGDRSLANSISFMCDALILEEFNYAVAEGDVGRVYEAMKMMVFTFAGSPHSKYTSYLLEFITVIELESSQELREAILSSMLINLPGEAGRFSPADLVQEYFNRLLQAIAERKGVEYNGHFLRFIVSRNLHHLARLSDELKSGVGLKARSGRHSAPHLHAELRTLLSEYKRAELHSRRPGRTYVTGEENFRVTDFRKGLASLRNGKLGRWIKESTRMRGPGRGVHPQKAPDPERRGLVAIHDEEDCEDTAGRSGDDDFDQHKQCNADSDEDYPRASDDAQRSTTTLPSMHISDGGLVLERTVSISPATHCTSWRKSIMRARTGARALRTLTLTPRARMTAHSASTLNLAEISLLGS